MIQKDTIFALSSGAGRAGIAVVRISGRAASLVFDYFGVRQPVARRAVIRRLRGKDGEVLDEALVLWLPGPQSATGEDMVELHLHGGPAIVEGVLRQLADVPGMRMAEAGEFTRRAFNNNRLDLLQVEGLGDALQADTQTQLRLAMRQFLGEASTVYERWRQELLKALALIEAAIDFSDEGDVVAGTQAMAMPIVTGLVEKLEAALASSERVAAVRRGLRVVIAGPPNVGKSSFLNWLAGRDAAIVSPMAGTTRDVVEAPLTLDGMAIVVADTAGLRQQSSDPIEQEGMRRSGLAMESADILVWLSAVDVDEKARPYRRPDLRVFNKVDLLEPSRAPESDPGAFPVSLLTGEGLDACKVALRDLIRERNSLAEDAVVVRERHRGAVLRALTLLRPIQTSPQSDLELVAENMRNAAQELAGVTGRIDAEDVLGQIFQDFCIGK